MEGFLKQSIFSKALLDLLGRSVDIGFLRKKPVSTLTPVAIKLEKPISLQDFFLVARDKQLKKRIFCK